MKFKDIATRKLIDMKDYPYVGGFEEIWVKRNGPIHNSQTEEHSKSVRTAKKRHKIIDGPHRGRPCETIRNEVITSAINFLEQSLDSDQEGLMKNLKEICSSDSPSSFLHASRPLLECAGIKDEKVKEFADNVYENFDEFKPSTDIHEKDYSVRILQMLRYVEKCVLIYEFIKNITVFIIFLVECIKIS